MAFTKGRMLEMLSLLERKRSGRSHAGLQIKYKSPPDISSENLAGIAGIS
jgi:hypothetical protein